MSIALPIVTFLCLMLLLALAPVYWHSRSVSVTSLIVWLMVCNLIQGVNSVLWSGNEVVRVPVWCDIGTKVLIGALTALPAACLCVCRRLWRYSSGKEDKKGSTLLSFDFILCVMLPIMCMGLQTIVQDHRFDLVQDYGCNASIYLSADAIILVWLPSLVLCIMTFLFAGLALHEYIYGGISLSSNFRNSPCLNMFKFIRPIINSILISSLMLASVAFTINARVTSEHGIKTVLSWQAVHSQMSVVNIISPQAKLEMARIALAWWVIPASSMVFIVSSLLCFICGTRNEALKRYASFSGWFQRSAQSRPRTEPLNLDSNRDSQPQMMLKSPTAPTRVHLPESKWDNTLRSSSFGPPKVKVPLPPLAIPGDTPNSPAESEDSFSQATQAYVGSPTGRKALGLPSFPPSLQRPLIRPPALIPPLAMVSDVFVPKPQARPDDIPRPDSPTHVPDSRPDSLLSGPWPRPPSTVPTPTEIDPAIKVSPPSPLPDSLTLSHSAIRPPSVSSISTSLASSTISTSAYAGAYYSPPAMPHDLPVSPHDSPFQDSPPVPPSLAVPKRIRRIRSKEALSRNLSLASLRGRDLRDRDPFGGIVMTVVKETT